MLALEKWKVTEHVEGVAAGKRIDLLGAVVLRVEMGCKHDRAPVYEKIRCKIFARGSASFNGIILGGRTLDAVSQGGMGLQIRDKSYYLALYDMFLPRLEGPKRKRRGEAMAMDVPPHLTVKHSALKVCVGASSVDSDAEDEDGCVQGVAGSAEEYVEHPARARCQLCRRQPGRRVTCGICQYRVGPGCCLHSEHPPRCIFLSLIHI